MFCPVTQNLRGHPLISRAVITALTAVTMTRIGLKIQSQIDDNRYPLGVNVSAAQMHELNSRRDGFHGEWNDTFIYRSISSSYFGESLNLIA